MTLRTTILLTLVGLAVLILPPEAGATHPCSSPLILDLNGDGIHTIGLNWPVTFDIDADGELDRIGWTFKNSQEAFLWLDHNRNRTLDDGSELFGDSTPMPDGSVAGNGFEALAVYDLPEMGGNGDGLIDRQDLIFEHLRLWVDSNGDAVSQQTEISTLTARGVVAIGLDFVRVNEMDGAGNLHLLRGGFMQRVLRFGRPFTITGIVDDVVFVVAGH